MTSFPSSPTRGRPLASLLVPVLAIALAGCAATGRDADRQVTIKRDTWGVPHIYANDTRGLFFGYGHAVAEDRLFQMEMARRAVLGTVAEVMGPDHVALDRGSRSAFTPDAIRAQLARLSPDDRAIFDGYAAGFNARVTEVLADAPRWMPKQFVDAGFQPKADWTGYDVAMIWVGTMANRFSNASSEVANLARLNQLKRARGEAIGRQLFDQIQWLEDPQAPTTVPRPGAMPVAAGTPVERSTIRSAGDHAARLAPVSPEALAASGDLDAARRGLAAPDQRPVASNLWIVGPGKTSDGSTIFVNGPQFGWVNPSYVYAVGLHGAGFDVVGNTPFAHPVVLFGTNGRIAWGSTAGPQDVNDVYQLRLDPQDPRRYAFDGGWRTMTERTEVIRVKGGADVTVVVQSSVHGLVTQVDRPNATAYAMRRAWDGREIESLLGWIRSMQARDWREWLAQAERVAITINWYYADADGNIGYVSPGRLPIRPPAQDVRLPAVGDGSMEWQGFRPFAEDPRVLNPAQGYIANWNNQPAPGATGDGNNYGAVDRVNEFIARLQAKPTLTPAEVWDLNRQTAYADTNLRYVAPSLVAATRALPPTDPRAKAARALADWDGIAADPRGTGHYDGPGPAILRAWLPIVYRRLLQADLPGPLFAPFASPGYANADTVGSIRPGNGTKLLFNALRGTRAGVPQTIDFFHGADPEAVLRETLGEAVADLTARQGADMAGWRVPVVPHRFLPKNFIGAPQAGADETLTLPVYMNRGTQNDQVVFAKGGGVSMCTVAPPGQSGFVAPDGTRSPHYADQMTLYAEFGCKPERLTPREVDAHLESTRVLRY